MKITINSKDEPLILTVASMVENVWYIHFENNILYRLNNKVITKIDQELGTWSNCRADKDCDWNDEQIMLFRGQIVIDC